MGGPAGPVSKLYNACLRLPPVIFEALERAPPSKGGKVQLADGIQKLIDRGLKVYAVELGGGR